MYFRSIVQHKEKGRGVGPGSGVGCSVSGCGWGYRLTWCFTLWVVSHGYAGVSFVLIVAIAYCVCGLSGGGHIAPSTPGGATGMSGSQAVIRAELVVG